MNLGRLFARLSIYRATRGVPLWVLVALAIGFYLLAGIGKAHASQYDGVNCSQSYTRSTESEAAYCAYKRKEAYDNDPSGRYEGKVELRCATTQHCAYGRNKTNNVSWFLDSQWAWPTSGACPLGTQVDINDDYNCRDPDEACRAINDEPGFLGVGPTARSFQSRCMANGCEFGIRPGTGYTATNAGTADAVYHGQYEWIGACGTPDAAEPPPEPEPQQECKDVGTSGNGSTIKACVQKDGRICLTAPTTGKQLCWTPGETGEKTTENVLQKREPGDKTAQPTPPTKPDLNQDGSPVKTVTTKQPENVTITTTITNYTTTNNTDAGPNDDGVPDTGDDSGGDSDQGSNEASGDGTCNSPWQTSGDAILGAILGEAWKLRCAGEKAAEDNTADAGTLGGIADGLEPGEGDSIFADGEPGGTGSGINDSMFSWGSGSCPVASLTFTMGGHEFVPPAAFCDTVAALSALFQLVALVWAMRIVGS
jgi:hypothetical protein